MSVGALQILAFTGKKRSGKSTAARAVVDAESVWTRRSFADPVREMLWELNPIIGSDSYGRTYTWRDAMELDGYEHAKEVSEFRRLMQVFATDVMRARYPDFWVNEAHRWCRVEGNVPFNRVVFDDLRFENEARWVVQMGGRVIRATAPWTTDDDKHVSEAGIDNQFVSGTVVNDGDEEKFQRAVRREVFRA